MAAERVRLGMLVRLCTLAAVVAGMGYAANAAPDWQCLNGSKCMNVACKDNTLPPGQFPCVDANNVPIPGCTVPFACTITDTTQYSLCYYTGHTSDNCVYDRSTIKKCDGTYTPTAGVPTYCGVQRYECNSNPPKGPDGKPLACTAS